MAAKSQKTELPSRLATRLGTDEQTAALLIEAVFETVYDEIKAGRSVTIRNFGNFYVRPERSTWVFRFNPAQRLRACFGWSSTYKGDS